MVLLFLFSHIPVTGYRFSTTELSSFIFHYLPDPKRFLTFPLLVNRILKTLLGKDLQLTRTEKYVQKIHLIFTIKNSTLHVYSLNVTSPEVSFSSLTITFIMHAFQSLNKMMLLKQFKITTAKYLL